MYKDLIIKWWWGRISSCMELYSPLETFDIAGCTLLSGNVIKNLVSGIVNTDAYSSNNTQILQEWQTWINNTHGNPLIGTAWQLVHFSQLYKYLILEVELLYVSLCP